MPISLAQLKSNLRTINVQYYEDNFSVTYRPSEMTPEMEAANLQMIEDGDGKNVIVTTLCRVMTAWDIVDEEGKPLPITDEVLNTLPSPLLLAISDAIGADARPKPKSAGRSFAR